MIQYYTHKKDLNHTQRENVQNLRDNIHVIYNKNKKEIQNKKKKILNLIENIPFMLIRMRTINLINNMSNLGIVTSFI